MWMQRTLLMIRSPIFHLTIFTGINMYLHYYFYTLLFLNSNYVLTSDLLSIFFNKYASLSIRSIIPEAIRYDLVEIGTYHRSPFVFDSDCISVIGTNTFLEHPCTLPPKCGKVTMSKKTTGIFGNEIIVCYSFHPIFDYKPITFMQVVPRNTRMTVSSDNERINLSNLVPTDFFDHFAVVLTPKFYVIPRICLDEYTYIGESLPESVKLDITGDVVTISHSHFNDTQCRPFYLADIDEFVRTFDYPIAYDGCSYSLSNHEKYHNQDPFVSTYHVYYSMRDARPYIYSIKQQYDDEPLVFYSYATLFEFQRFKSYNYDVDMNTSNAHYIHADGRNFSASITTYSFPISYLYRSPFTILVEHLKSFFEFIFYKLLYLIRQEATEIVKLCVHIFCELVTYVFNDLILSTFGMKFYTYIIALGLLYFYFSDFLKASIVMFILVFISEIVLS